MRPFYANLADKIKRLKTQTNLGFSLIEVVVAMGLLSVVSLRVMTMIKTQNDMIKRARITMTRDMLKFQLERLRQINGLFDPNPKYPRKAPGVFL